MSTPTGTPFPWTSLDELQDPFNDAVNYKTRQQKQFFNKIFLRTDDLHECLKPSTYYLIGEKGSGKTAYAVYLENNEEQKTKCKLTTMTETQYKRFIALKKKGQLDYSDYANIWRPMLLNLVAHAIVSKSKGVIASLTGKFSAIEKEISEFDSGTLNPEVEVAFELITKAGGSATIGNDKVASIRGEASIGATEKIAKLAHNLLERETRLKVALQDLRLSHNHVLFIDGIDYRPEGVPYQDYLECIKGLGEAAWQLNTDFFGNIRDSAGRIKVVLLVRPDVFHELNLYNSNSRLRDNSVLLDWSTTEANMRSSPLYEATGKVFSAQQKKEISPLDAADQYLDARDNNFIFRRLLRSTFQKPRDVLTFIKTARNVSIKKLGRGSDTFFSSDALKDSNYTKEFADYMLGEVKNYATFYMPQNDFYLYIKFFQYLDGKAEFTFQHFDSAFNRFKAWISGESVKATKYLRDSEALLQFFYDVNIIGYQENVGLAERFVHFSFRERSLTNIAPKIKITGMLVINPGVSKALDIGLQTINSNAGVAPSKRKRIRRGRLQQPLDKNRAQNSDMQRSTENRSDQPRNPNQPKPGEKNRRRR